MPNSLKSVPPALPNAYPVNPQVVFGFLPDTVIVTAAQIVFFSFDGAEDHGRVPDGTAISVETKRQKVWLRQDPLDPGASATVAAHTRA